MLRDLFVVIVLFITQSVAEETIGYNNTDCLEPTCLKCGPKGCMKCPSLIVYPSRECVNICPHGYNPKWSTIVDIMGKVCVHNGNFLGLSTNAIAVLTGVFTGVILCTIFILLAGVYLRYKRKKFPPLSETSSELDDGRDRKDFIKQLETLRPYAKNYLDMLNDTRKQLRELHQNGDNNAISAYKPVLRDLAKILILLNKPTEKITVPDDWEHLFNWAEKALKRYKRMSEPQIAQLIDFLQDPVIPAEEPDYSVRGSTTMSTFKPEQIFGSSASLEDVAVKNFNSNYESTFPQLNPQWKFEYSLVSNNAPSSEFNPQLWKNSKEYLNSALFSDDDFCQLGFRPQDEITTEL
ncbi:unnamed protein product [Brassicogethes aeneus]|uniref:Uncharacterized protein n=1 Tax=Brassicogethes aeneus TaxID=1431903 RepID=A0A9P0FMI2_BRAAE|nr:unnamed protein product [Brassicogethes aeneus]